MFENGKTWIFSFDLLELYSELISIGHNAKTFELVYIFEFCKNPFTVQESQSSVLSCF